MDAQILSERLSTDLGERKTTVLTCSCSIEYWGRSRSVIGCGDRIILFKPDSTVIVHSPRGFKPVNWMSSPTDTSADLEDGRTVVFSQRTVKPYEEMKITVDKVIEYTSLPGLRDEEKIDVTHTERDMRDYLEKHPREVHPDFRLKTVEHHITPGFIDLYGKIGDRYVVVELKAVKAGLPAVLQLKRYRDWLREKLRQPIHAILMAPGIAKNPHTLLKKEGMEFKKFNVHKLEIKKEKNTLEKWMN
ncbi:MAG: DUF91 domain-containing protein [Candidatus Altiarchaeales archaeon]|nr:DUF91 domain-containing protein [Candidatus Altiarchaeales archaeon]MBD3415540.1 DUF91 domain-containing protein [Candidatus Altiarchaeales archaeon]